MSVIEITSLEECNGGENSIATGEFLGQPFQADTGSNSGVHNTIPSAFSPEEKILAVVDDRSAVYLWPGNMEAWHAQACRIADSNLTPEEWKRYLGDEPYRVLCPNIPPCPCRQRPQ